MDTTSAPTPIVSLLDARAVAHLLGLHPKTVLKLARRGGLPALRYLGYWRFRGQDLEAWLEAQRFVPTERTSIRPNAGQPTPIPPPSLKPRPQL